MSINTGLRPVVENVVDTKVQNGDMFTAHDVTLEARSRGHKAGHNDVRDAVHDYYSRGGMGVAYTRTTITVPLGGTPFLYHRQADDPTEYQNIRGQGQAPTASAPTIAVPPPSSITNDNDNDEDEDEDEDEDDSAIAVPAGLLGSVAGVAVASKPKAINSGSNVNRTVARTTDARDTLSVPANLIRNAGFKPLQTVYVSVVGETLEITPSQKAGFSRKYTVDSHGQVRVTQHLLKRANIGGATYNLAWNTAKVTIQKHK